VRKQLIVVDRAESRIIVRHAGAGGENTAWNTRDFSLSASDDGTTWTPLASVTGNLVIDSDPALTQLLLGSLTHVGGNLAITHDPALPTCFGALVAQLVGFKGTLSTGGDGPACP